MRVLLEAQALSQRGHKVLVLCDSKADLLDRSIKSKIPVEKVSMGRSDFVFAIRKCQKVIEKHGVDLINTHSSRDSWIGSIAGRFSSRKPIILRTRHLSIPLRMDPMSRLLYRNLPHGVITTGKVIRDELIHKYGIPKERIASVPTGVELEQFNPKKTKDTFKEELKLDKGQFLVGMVSALRSWKGHLDLIEASQKVIHKFPSLVFVIVGEGPMKSLIQGKIDKLGLQEFFLFLGFREDIPEILSSLDLFSFVSHP